MKRIYALLIIIAIITSMTSCSRESIFPIENECFHEGCEWIEESSPSCLTEGKKVLNCPKCGEIYDTIPMLQHDYISEIVADATCVDDGIERHTCTLCSDTYDTAISAIGHQFEFVKPEGADICQICNNKHYTTLCANALKYLYTNKVISKYATIDNIEVLTYKLNSSNKYYNKNDSECIAIITSVNINGKGNQYLSFYYPSDDTLYFDVLGDLKDQIEFYDTQLKYYTGAAQIKLLDEQLTVIDINIKYLDLCLKVLLNEIPTQEQNVQEVVRIAKDMSEMFN